MIGIGITENVMLKNASIDEKNRLVIEFAPAKAEEAKKSLFDESLTAGVQKEGKDGISLTIFPPLVSKKTDITDEKKAEMMHGDLKKLNNQLVQICQQYMLNEEINLHEKDVKYAGTSITAETYERLMLDQETVNRVYDNVTKRFVELIKPFAGNPEFPVRLKLIRQSKDKHYATLPGRFIDENPFIELMMVPKESSRVRFTEWEKSQGLDSAEVVTSSAAEKKGENTGSQTEAPAVNPFAGD